MGKTACAKLRRQFFKTLKTGETEKRESLRRNARARLCTWALTGVSLGGTATKKKRKSGLSPEARACVSREARKHYSPDKPKGQHLAIAFSICRRQGFRSIKKRRK